MLKERATCPPFPCYDCERMGDDSPRCGEYGNCLKWNDWANAQTQAQVSRNVQSIMGVSMNKHINNWDIFEDRVRSLLRRWNPNHPTAHWSPEQAVRGFMEEVSDGYTSLLMHEGPFDANTELKGVERK